MGRAEALVVDQFILLMLPDRALDVERRLCLGCGPAVAATLDVVRVMPAHQLVARLRDLHAEESLIFRRIEMMIQCRIDIRARFLPVAHMTSRFDVKVTVIVYKTRRLTRRCAPAPPRCLGER